MFSFQSLKCTRNVFLLAAGLLGYKAIVLVLTRNHAQVARLAEHLPVQRIAAVLIWFWRELDIADLQRT